MIFYIDKQYEFIEYFNEQNGTLIRSNVLKDGVETEKVPIMRSFPELIDIGIMGRCLAGQQGICRMAGVDCYQCAPKKQRSNMTLEDYKSIIEQCTGRTFQVALGGAGDPNKHERFEDILVTTVANRIVPNLTTSGYKMTPTEVSLIKKYCGAVAVSYYSRLDQNNKETNFVTINAIESLLSAGCVTNVHYVLSRESIDEAIKRLEYGLFPNGINAVVFLLYKPVGLARDDKVLSIYDPRYIDFLRIVSNGHFPFSVGMDSCQAPALTSFSPTVAAQAIEFCDAARFSMYIDCQLRAFPCSFGHNRSQYAVNLKNATLKDAWNSKQFQLFREKQWHDCKNCPKAMECRGCALDLGVALCERC